MKKLYISILALCICAITNAANFYINPGHGGHDSDDRPTAMPLGVEMFYESDGNLDRGFHLRDFLQGLGCGVKMSRTTNYSSDDLALSTIASYSNSYGGYFMSLHSNGANASANYVISFFKGYSSSYPNVPSGAEAMAKAVSNWHSNNILTNVTYSTPRGISDYSFYGYHLGVLRTNTRPGYLVESWFHDYRPEALRMKSTLYNKYLAWQIARAAKDSPGISSTLSGCVIGDIRDVSKSCGYTNYTTRGRDSYLALNGVTVKLINSSGTTVATCTTDNCCNGFYGFFGLSAGTYTIQVSKSGYKSQTATVSVSNNASTKKTFDLSEGVDTGISLNPTTATFNSTTVGTTSSKSITVTGTGLSANIIVSNTDNTNFSISTTSFGASGGTLTVTYKPQSAGNHSTTISFASGSNKTSMVVSGSAVNPPLQLTEVWNFSENKGNKASWMTEYSNYRNMAFGNGKLYVVDTGAGVIRIINSQDGSHLGDLDMTGVSGGALSLVDVAFVDGKLIGTNLTTSSLGTPLKVYIWDNDKSAPRVLLETTDIGSMNRIGDCIEVKGNLTNGELVFLGQQTRTYNTSSTTTATGNCNTIIRYAITNGTVSTTPQKGDIDGFIIGLSPRAVPYGNDYFVVGQNYLPSVCTAAGELTTTVSTSAFNCKQGNDFVPFTYKGDTFAFATDYAAYATADVATKSLLGGRAILLNANSGWTEATKVGEYPSGGMGNTTRNTSMSSSICVAVNGDKGVEMWVLIHNQGIAYYRAGTTPTYVFEDLPTLSVSETSLTFETEKCVEVSRTINVSGVDLEGDITLSLTGANADQFTLSENTISKASANRNITVTYKAQEYGTHTAEIGISSPRAADVRVALKATNGAVYVLKGYELTQDWSVKSGLMAAADTRWAALKDGKMYVNDHANKLLYYIDQSGFHSTGIATSAGSAIASDDAGNLVISTSFNSGSGSTSFKLIPNGSTTAQDLALTLPSDVTAGINQYLGHITGNIMDSSKGGAMFIMPNGATSVAKFIIKSGAQSETHSIPVGAVTADMQTITFSLSSDPASDAIAVRKRGDKHFYVHNGTEFAAYPDNGVNLTAGGTMFTFCGKRWGVEPIGTNYCDGFQVVNYTDNEVVATHTAEIGTPAAKPNANCIMVNIKDEWTAEIYQYVPGSIAAKYTFAAIREIDAVEEVEAQQGLIVNNGTELVLEGVDAASFAVYSVTGGLVRNSNSNVVDIEGLKGVHIAVAIDAAGNTYTLKFIAR